MTKDQHFLKFSYEYPKLDHPLFTTIRRYDKYPEAGALMEIVTPIRRFSAFLILKLKKRIGDLDTTFLTLDTGAQSRHGSFRVLQSFYKTAISEDEIFTILFLRTHRTGLEKIKVNDQWLGAEQVRIDMTRMNELNALCAACDKDPEDRDGDPCVYCKTWKEIKSLSTYGDPSPHLL